jgi:hypothetical protein
VLASGQVEGMLRMNNQTSFMMEDLVCVYAKRFCVSRNRYSSALTPY